METHKIDLIIQYALLVAGQEDEYVYRQLGPIHLIKYVYLADLACAERNHGQTFTGINWQFYKFGPWSQKVHERIEPALIELNANKKEIPSKFNDKDDWIRWQLTDDDLLDNIERQLPVYITSPLRRDIHRFGSDTTSLLSYVYQTSPMLLAAPHEYLDFSHLNQTNPQTELSSPSKYEELSASKKKKFKKRIQELRKKNAERSAAGRRTTQLVNPVTSPRYDNVYYEGLKWLDSLAGSPLKECEVEAIFSDSVWKSSTRKGEDVS
jgi:hypothetical protein